MNQLNVIDPRQFLSSELRRRCEVNPQYSMRAFARTLQMTQAGLSLILSGKRNISRKAAVRIADILALGPEVRAAFYNGCAQVQSSETTSEGQQIRDLSLDQFELISAWYHYGILSLIETKDFKPSIRHIAKRLGISFIEAKEAVDRLVRMDLLDTSSPRWKQIGGSISIDNKISTPATRKWTKAILDKAAMSLENDPESLRSMTCMTMAIDPKYIPLAEPEIKKFRRRLMNFLEGLGQPKEVYNLAVQLYPVSKSD